MTPTERTLSIRLLILKSRLKDLIIDLEENARTRPRRGLYYRGFATELRTLVTTFEKEELGLIETEVKD